VGCNISSVASWANTGKATIWRCTGTDDWTHVKTFAQPLVIAVSYTVKNERMTMANGQEFVSTMKFWTEYSLAGQGDYIAVGEFTSIYNPLLVDSSEIKAVLRDQDVFENIADDYTLVT
jgi:hypothetical protein